MKTETKTYSVRVRVTRIEKWYIDAESEEEALKAFESGETDHIDHVDTPDWEVQGSVKNEDGD